MSYPSKEDFKQIMINAVYMFIIMVWAGNVYTGIKEQDIIRIIVFIACIIVTVYAAIVIQRQKKEKKTIEKTET